MLKPLRIVTDSGMIKHVYTDFRQLFTDKLRVRIGDLAEQKLRADCNDLCFFAISIFKSFFLVRCF